MNAERRNHHHRNYREVQKHDGGLAPGVLPKTPLASQPSAKQKTYPHDHFEDENDIGAARSGRFKECCYQQFVSTQTYRLRSVRYSAKSLAWQRKVAPHSLHDDFADHLRMN